MALVSNYIEVVDIGNTFWRGSVNRKIYYSVTELYAVEKSTFFQVHECWARPSSSTISSTQTLLSVQICVLFPARDHLINSLSTTIISGYFTFKLLPQCSPFGSNDTVTLSNTHSPQALRSHRDIRRTHTLHWHPCIQPKDPNTFASSCLDRTRRCGRSVP